MSDEGTRVGDAPSHNNEHSHVHDKSNHNNYKPHVFHLNLPSHFMDPNDQVPWVTKFGHSKLQQLIDLIFSIQLTESMFHDDDNNHENETDTMRAAASNIAVANGDDDVDMEQEDDPEDAEEDDTEAVVPFGDTDVTIPTTTLLQVCKRCARIVALLSTIESLKCSLFTNHNTTLIMRLVLHLLRLVTATITYEVVVVDRSDTGTGDRTDSSSTSETPDTEHDDDTSPKRTFRTKRPKLHFENVGTILHFHDRTANGHHDEYDAFTPATSEEQLEQELLHQSFALPTPTREVLFTAIIHLLSNKKGVLRSVSNTSIYSDHDDTTNSNYNRSLLIIHWEVLLRMLLRTAPYLNEYQTSMPVLDSNSHTNTIIKRTVQLIRHSRRFFEQGIRPPNYYNDDPNSSNAPKLDQTARAVWNMVQHDVLYQSHTHACYRGAILLYLFLPSRCSTEFYVSTLLPNYWTAWTNIDRMDEYDYLWLTLYCRARKYVSYDSYSDGWDKIRKRIITHCQYWFQLPIGGTSYDTSFPRVANPRSRTCPSKLKVFVGNGSGSSSYYDEAMDFIAKITKLLVTGLGAGKQISSNSDNETTVDKTLKSISEGTNDMLLFLAYATPYFNPSNMGQWTATLGAFLHYFSYELCCRIGSAAGNSTLQQSHPNIIKTLNRIHTGSHCSDIPAHEVVLLLNTLIPLCQQTLYSKNSHVGRAGEAAMLYLVQIDPIHTTPSLLDFTCRALDVVSINLSHQAPAAMSALTRLIQPSLRCDPNILLSRLPNILHLTLAGIDCNDQNKTIRTLIFYRSLLCWMPIGLGHGSVPHQKNDSETVTMKGRDDGTIQFGHNLYEILSRQRQSAEYKAAIEALPSTSLLKEGRYDVNEVAPDMQKLFREEALLSLSDWALEFLDRIFELLRASGDREKKAKRSSGVASRHTSADVQQARNFSRVLKETLSQLFSSMDNETHVLAIRTVYKFLEEETLPSAAKDASLLCQAVAASRTGEVISPGLDLLIPLLCDDLSSHSMKTVTYRLRCLSGAVRSASHSVVKHRQMISAAISFALQSDDRHLFKTGCKLLRHTLTTLVEAYPHSYNFCPQRSDSAGNWFLGKSAELHSDFVQWHVPNRESMQLACSLIHNHVIEFLNSFVSINPGSGGIKMLGTLDINDIRRCLRVIRYSIRGGASILHDSVIDSAYKTVTVPYEAATNAVLHFVDDNVRQSICAVRGRISGFLVVLASIIASETFHPSGLNDLPPNDPCRKVFSTISADPKICKETTDLSLLLLTRRGSAYRSQEAKTIWEAQKQVTCDFLLTSQVDQIFEVLQYAAQFGDSERVLYKDGEGGGKTIPRRLLVSRAQLFHDTLQRNSSFEIPRRLRIVERNACTVRTRLFNVKSKLSEMVVNLDGMLTLSTKSPLDGYEGIADCLYALCCHSNAQVRSSALSVIDYTMTRFGWLVAIRVPRLLSALSLGDEGMNGKFGVPSFCALSNDVNQQGRRKKLADAVSGVCSILSLSRAMKHILQSERLRYQFTTTICGTERIVSLLPTEELQKMVHYMQSVFSQFRSRVYFLPQPSAKEKEFHYSTLSFAMDILSEKNGENGKPNGENGTGVHWRKRLLACWFILTFIDDDIIDLSEPIAGKAWSTCIHILEMEKGQPLQRVGLGLFGRLVHLTTNNNTACHPLLQEKMASSSFCRILGEALVFDHKEDTSVSGGHDAQWATGVEDIIRDAARSIAPRNIFPFQRTNQASGEFKPSHSQLVELALATVDSETANIAALHLLEFANDMISSLPSEDQRNQQITAAEIFGGICGSFFRQPGQTYRFEWHDVLQSHLEDGIGKIAFALSGAYFDSLRYALQFSPPEKVVALTNWVIDKLITNLWQPPRNETFIDVGKVLETNLLSPAQGTEGFTTQSKWLYLFTAVLTEIDDSVIKVAIHGFWYKSSLLSDANAEQKLQVSDDPAVLDTWRSIFDSVLPSILSAVGHPFDSCRDHIARCLFRICFCSRKLSRFRSSQSLSTVENSNLFPDPGLAIVEAILSLEKNSAGMAFVERYNAISTARRFVSYCVQLGEARFEYSTYIIPLLRLIFEAINPTIDNEVLQLGSENPEVEAAKRALEAEVIKSCRFTLAEVSVSVVISYGDDTDQKRILDVIATACKHESWQVRQAAIHFFRCFQGAHKFQFSAALTERTMLIIAEMLTDDRREVCSAAMAALTGLLASLPSEIVGRLVQSYIHLASSSLLPNISKKVIVRNSVVPEKVDFAFETKRAQNQKKSVFFLCAAITAQPYETPLFVPAALAAISKHSFERNAPLSVRDAVKRCCADYKKNHMSDNWESHRKVFSQEQLEALEDVVSTPHYYA